MSRRYHMVNKLQMQNIQKNMKEQKKTQINNMNKKKKSYV